MALGVRTSGFREKAALFFWYDEAVLSVRFTRDPVVGGVIGELRRPRRAAVLQQRQHGIDDRLALRIGAIGQVLGEQALLQHVAVRRLTIARHENLDLVLLARVLDHLCCARRLRPPYAEDAAKIRILLQYV